jgi:hypothetical protein
MMVARTDLQYTEVWKVANRLTARPSGYFGMSSDTSGRLENYTNPYNCTSAAPVRYILALSWILRWDQQKQKCWVCKLLSTILFILLPVVATWSSPPLIPYFKCSWRIWNKCRRSIIRESCSCVLVSQSGLCLSCHYHLYCAFMRKSYNYIIRTEHNAVSLACFEPLRPIWQSSRSYTIQIMRLMGRKNLKMITYILSTDRILSTPSIKISNERMNACFWDKINRLNKEIFYIDCIEWGFSTRGPPMCFVRPA